MYVYYLYIKFIVLLILKLFKIYYFFNYYFCANFILMSSYHCQQINCYGYLNKKVCCSEINL